MADWSKLKVVDLKAELKRRDLPQTGLKADLIARLDEADELAAQADPQATEAEAEKAQPTEGETTQAGAGSFDDDNAITEPGANGTEASASAEEAPQDDTSMDQTEEQEPSTETLTRIQEHRTETSSMEAPAPIGHSAEFDQSGATTVEEHHEPSTTTNQDDQMATDAPSTPEALDSHAPGTLDDDVADQGEVTSTIPTSQGLKRRSKSPLPDDDTGTRKRTRTGSVGAVNRQMAPLTNMPHVHEERSRGASMDIDRDVQPAIHPATNAIYVRNLMRPLRQQDLESHLVNLATPSTESLDTNVVDKLFLDPIRSHAFVVFTSVSAASRARAQFHDTVWPKESNRKPLFVDFIPSEKVQDWIDQESVGGARSRTRWEVNYETNDNGDIEARLVSGAMPSTSGSAPIGPANTLSGANALPTGPRAMRDPPRGPRGFQGDSNLPPHPGRRGPSVSETGSVPATFDASFQRTITLPAIAYKLIPEELAQRRLANMRSFYTKDVYKYLGHDVNRYSFDGEGGFVDRGKEMYAGIRPQHGERPRREGRGGFFDGRRGGWRGGRVGRGGRRGGPPGGNPNFIMTDSYVPGGGGGRRLFNEGGGNY